MLLNPKELELHIEFLITEEVRKVFFEHFHQVFSIFSVRTNDDVDLATVILKTSFVLSHPHSDK